ncbi:similar to Saccharomyces cerevisiae YDR419W RAD30 DNA polymerase eta, involved in translesion synthesis during post-replication repair [Maudiozyma saulgeensis]|uniref:Similar to Saccharomyces cerevisiae YDR419W RAD30 DNA polymerase eta, involved in translesion synthesis during post-replication repair n=1 Tax=Maudiozyma saulgeensis TaxID=1789683 RepID=A0A1X7R1V1_9SACH|nr:similar to Saccharomyces cerevisiae YDR419W RAD30 DNA polymerase eta, involved in translesion synthesis during post-replication repair [Kazachstania saulgeensis]
MSQFTWKDLIQLNSDSKSYLSPLSCMAHVDVNAFFAQAEQIRCGYTRDDPIVCVQWNSIIAVSYAARKYGISRLDTIGSAMEKSGNKLIPIHTAVFRRGEDYWQYHDGCGSWNSDKSKQIPANLYKVSLDPYRRESRKIFRIFRKHSDRVEKASVDEVFLDLGKLCFQRLLTEDIISKSTENCESLGILREIFQQGEYNIDSTLPTVPEELKLLNFVGDVYNPENKPLIEDWDDVIFAIGSQLVGEMRDDIEDSLGFTTSAGIARTKYVAKLGSNFKKPDAQTVILNKYVQDFLDGESFDITSFWTFGGKIGNEICTLLKTPETGSIKFIRENWPDGPQGLHNYLNKRILELSNTNEIQTLDSSKTEALSQKLYDISRGKFLLPLNEKPIVKSMMSNKNMRKDSCCNIIHAISWIEVFSGELTARIKELEQEYSKLIVPKTVVLLATTLKKKVYRKTGHFIHNHSELTPKDFIQIGTKLMQDIDNENYGAKNSFFYPLLNLSITISNFEIFDTNKTIVDMFGNHAKILTKTTNNTKEVEGGKQEELNLFCCKFCNINFETNKEFQEHKDFHVALKLSDAMNGISEDSKNLTIGERRLLLNKKRKNFDKTPPKTNKKSKGKRGSTPGILSFFSK